MGRPCQLTLMPSALSRQSFASCLREDLLFFVLISGFACAIGLLINTFRQIPLPLSYEDKEQRILLQAATAGRQEPDAVAANAPAAKDISLEELKEVLAQKNAIVLDARPEIFHRLGHIPGALSLPRESFQEVYSLLQERLAKEKDRLVVVYCASKTCEDAGLVRKALVALGFTHISIFPGGWDEWTRSGGEKAVKP